MTRMHLNRALLICAATLLTASAYGQSPNANPQGKGHAADDAKKAGDIKTDDKGKEAKGDDKAKEGKEGKGDDKAKSASDHAARVAKEHGEQKAQLSTMLKGPMDSAVKEELHRHAERIARLERIKSLATDAKDADATERATKLMTKENARHDKWMEKHAAMPAAVTNGGAK